MSCGVRDRSFFNPHFVIRDAPLRVWIAGLPAAVRGWKLEAVKHSGSNPPVLEGAGYNEVYTAAAGQLYTKKGLLCSPFFSLFSGMCHTISTVLPRMASNVIWYLHIAAQSFIMTGYVTNHAALCRATTFKLERMDNK